MKRLDMIKISSNSIATAQVLLNDNNAIRDYVNRVYKNCDKRGMWHSVRKQARIVMALAEKHGLTKEKPVFYVRENGTITTYGLIFSCDFIVPLFGGKSKPK